MASKRKAKKSRKPRVIARITQVGIVKGRFISKRECVLRDAIDTTTGDRNAAYGDPLPQHRLAATLKERFWTAFNIAGHRDGGIDQLRETTLGRASAHGEALDVIFTKLSRLACQPSATIRRDTYLDIAAYAAIAFEVGTLTQGEQK